MDTWSSSYSSVPPWDVEHPQQAFVELVKHGELKPSRVLDIGSGPGENTIFLAENGFSAMGIDFTPEAVEIARNRAIKHGVRVDFVVGNVLNLEQYFLQDDFDYIIDSGLFHSIGLQDLSELVRQIRRALKPGGVYYILCFSDKEPPGRGPRRVSKEEIRRTLEPDFAVDYTRDTIFESRIHPGGARAYLTRATNRRSPELHDVSSN
ncbi:MAG: class I SAM-dependent methyltransferase [Candidatus Thorarchaeota archaeon]|jgi:SAM-dependent methyltransferase